MLFTLITLCLSDPFRIYGGSRYSQASEKGVYIARYAVFRHLSVESLSGGAIYLSSALKLDLFSCIFEQCSAHMGSGGCLFCNSEDINISNTCFTNSTASESGKCIFTDVSKQSFITHTSFTLTGFYNDPYTSYSMAMRGMHYDISHINSSDHQKSSYGAAISCVNLQTAMVFQSHLFNATETFGPVNNHNALLVTYDHVNIIKCADKSTITGVVHAHSTHLLMTSCIFYENTGRVLLSVYVGGTIVVDSCSIFHTGDLTQGSVSIENTQSFVGFLSIKVSQCAPSTHAFTSSSHQKQTSLVLLLFCPIFGTLTL